MDADFDPGERAAIALAKKHEADLLLIDDQAGRAEARRLGLRLTGTLGVLWVAAEKGHIDVPAVLTALRETNFYRRRLASGRIWPLDARLNPSPPDSDELSAISFQLGVKPEGKRGRTLLRRHG